MHTMISSSLQYIRAPYLQCGGPGFDPWVGKTPWSRKCQPTPGFLPGKLVYKEKT